MITEIRSMVQLTQKSEINFSRKFQKSGAGSSRRLTGPSVEPQLASLNNSGPLHGLGHDPPPQVKESEIV